MPRPEGAPRTRPNCIVCGLHSLNEAGITVHRFSLTYAFYDRVTGKSSSRSAGAICICRPCLRDIGRGVVVQLDDGTEVPDSTPARPFKHGVSGYVNYACRCPTCRAANTNYTRTRRRRARERELISYGALNGVMD